MNIENMNVNIEKHKYWKIPQLVIDVCIQYIDLYYVQTSI